MLQKKSPKQQSTPDYALKQNFLNLYFIELKKKTSDLPRMLQYCQNFTKRRPMSP